MQQKKEKYQTSSSQKQKRKSSDRKGPQTREKRVENRSLDFKEKSSARKSSGSERHPDPAVSKKKFSPRFEYEDDYIFWCRKCNLPLIGEECGICGGKGEILHLSQPADVRFCSPMRENFCPGS